MTGLVWLVVIIIILIGLLQIPLLCDLLRSCAPNYAPKRIVGPVLDTIVVCVMCAVFTAVFHLFFWVFLPAHLEYKDPWLDSTGLYHITLFWYLYLSTISNYICTVFTQPGTPPRVTMTPDTHMSISIESCIPKEKICLECKCMKAETTHHCKVCKQCIMHMDHHCPFVLGCVGLNNYHYFYSFMVYFYLGMLYGIYMSSGPFLHCHGWPYENRNYACEDGLSIASWMCVVVCLNIPGATLMNSFNLLALFSNTSTMSCLVESLNAGLGSAARGLFTRLSFRNFSDSRSRFYVLLISKRDHPVLFFIPPVLTAGRLFFKHCLTKKRTIQFTFPRLPKKVSLTA
ncbi:hypothetical protein ACHWQZ_G006168 [Mnemiopsis leidyi]